MIKLGNITRKRNRSSKRPKDLIFYSCLFGPTGELTDTIPTPPAKGRSIFYTNNKDAAKKAKKKGWKVIVSSTPIKESDRENAMDSKEVKACPHHFPELQGYEYTCYFDSKLKVKQSDVRRMIKQLQGDVVMMLNQHSHVANAVWDEFKLAMEQPRYAEDKEKYEKLIHDKLKSGLKDTAPNHYETGFILRKSGDRVNEIGEEWLKDIRATGPECQISFFFIQQKFAGSIKPTESYYGKH